MKLAGAGPDWKEDAMDPIFEAHLRFTSEGFSLVKQHQANAPPDALAIYEKDGEQWALVKAEKLYLLRYWRRARAK